MSLVQWWQWLFKSDFDEACEAEQDRMLSDLNLPAYSKVKRYTMGDNTVHFRAFVCNIKTGKLGLLLVERPVVKLTGCLGVTIGEPSQGGFRYPTYEDAKQAADNMAAWYSANEQKNMIIKIEDV